MKTIILCDIDGVLADCGHRLEYLNYGAAMAEDNPILAGIDLISALCLHSYECALWILTGRPERTRHLTELWIKGKTRLLFNEERLLMRADDDHRPAPEVKVEQVRAALGRNKTKAGRTLKQLVTKFHRLNGTYTPPTIYFIDDDPENVKAVCKAFPEITGIVFGVKRME